MLAPTRELAIQITNELTKMKHSPEEFKIVTVYGGVSVMDQANQLKRGVDLFVGTTGRVLDHIERGNIDFSDTKTVILDEADVMLKLGFKEDVEKILSKVRSECPKGLQVLLFSATVPDWVRDIAKEHMKPNFRVVDLAQDLKKKTARNIRHIAIHCHYRDRLPALSKVLNYYGGTGRIIVFTSTKADANSLLLSDQITHDVEVMHGDIAQNQREVTIKRFKDFKFQVLVATDVAARGLDIPNVELVIQIEPPKDTESYIHRSGRTARAGNSGTCITFYNQKNEEFLHRIEDLAGIKMERPGVPSDEDMLQAKTKDVLKKLKDVDMAVLDKFDETSELLISQQNGDVKKSLKIALAYCSGHYKQSVPTRSLLTGKDRMVTIQMNVEQGKQLTQDQAKTIIQKYWAPKMAEQITYMKSFSDGSGVVFDLKSIDGESFVENYKHLKETQDSRRVDFNVQFCSTLPPLEDGGSRNYGGGGSSYSRNNGGGGGGFGGGYGGNNGGGRSSRGPPRYNGGGDRGYGGGDRGSKQGGDRREGGGRSYNGGGSDWKSNLANDQHGSLNPLPFKLNSVRYNDPIPDEASKSSL
jgi:ATP-dependent RNA helicase DDX21